MAKAHPATMPPPVAYVCPAGPWEGLERQPMETGRVLQRAGLDRCEADPQRDVGGRVDGLGEQNPRCSSDDDNDNDNDNDTLREVPHQSNEGLALQARVSGPWSLKKESVLLGKFAPWQGVQIQTVVDRV